MRTKALLQQTTFLKYMLFLVFLPLFILNACEKNYGKKQETIKELMATASANIAVAGGDTLKFIDLSLGVTNRTWTFPGGDPATSDKAEVGVVFNEEGEIAPKLVVEYFDGSKDSISFDIQIFPVLIADFTPSATRIKVGETVTFSDASIGGATSWSWEFEGGTPATSTDQNPTVQFDINKAVSVKLQITRADDGSTASVEKKALIQVGPPELILNGDFESGEVVDWQTWNGSAFPYSAEPGGANGTDYTSYINFIGSWGWGQIISRDFVNNMVALENGRDYILSMYVKADAPGISLGTFRLVNHLPDWCPPFGVTGVAEPYTEYYAVSGTAIPFDITTDWQQVSIQVSIPDDGNTRSNAFPDMIFNGALDVKVYIDEISLKIVE